MNDKNLLTNNSVIAFMFSCLIFGFLAVGVASAETAGGFTNKEYSIKGGWSVETMGDQNIIKFTGDFKTKKGPDLKVFLSPRLIESVSGADATQEAVLVSKLKSNKGEQVYVLPEGIDLADFQSILIHCEAYSVLWGGANLPQTSKSTS